MFSIKRPFLLAGVACVAAAVSFSFGEVSAQGDLGGIRIPQIGGQILIDGDAIIGGNGGVQFQRMNNRDGVRFSQRRINGRTEMSLTKAGTTIKVEEADDSIIVDVVRTYTSEDVEDLKKDHPKIAKAMLEFPKKSGKTGVDLKVTLSRTFEGIDEEDLQGVSKDGFKYYKQVKDYAKKNSGRRGFRVMGGGFDRFEKMFEEQDRMMQRMLKDMDGVRGLRIIPAPKKAPKKKIKGIAT